MRARVVELGNAPQDFSLCPRSAWRAVGDLARLAASPARSPRASPAPRYGASGDQGSLRTPPTKPIQICMNVNNTKRQTSPRDKQAGNDPRGGRPQRFRCGRQTESYRMDSAFCDEVSYLSPEHVRAEPSTRNRILARRSALVRTRLYYFLMALVSHPGNNRETIGKQTAPSEY